jgi:hypothetical protein
MAGETIVNEQGGAQSALHGDPQLIPAEALLRLSQVCAEGALKYARNNWRRISFEDHLSHALEHVFLYMNGDRSEDHMGHALTRLAFAVAMEPNEGFDFKMWRPLPVAEGVPK